MLVVQLQIDGVIQEPEFAIAVEGTSETLPSSVRAIGENRVKLIFQPRRISKTETYAVTYSDYG